jgi:hypothetical protein
VSLAHAHTEEEDFADASGAVAGDEGRCGGAGEGEVARV